MKYRNKRWAGFTIVEIMIVIVVIGILVGVTIVGYNGIQRQAANNAVLSTLNNSTANIVREIVREGTVPLELPPGTDVPDDVTLIYVPPSSTTYSNLSAVQEGVLFYEICEELIADPEYSTIHSANGQQTSSVVMRCDDNIQDDRLQITGWDTRTWTTPVTKENIEAYMDTVPYDSWWIDRQEVVRSFYATLMSRFITSGGEWPITSFWDPWANQWAGVPREDLPAPDPLTETAEYCLMGTHNNFIDMSFYLTASNTTPREGSCQ